LVSTLDEVEKLLSGMTPGEKTQLLHRIVRDLGGEFPGIDQRPEGCGGAPCVVRTRIPVWVLEQARRIGASEVDLLRAYPGLRREDLANAWAFARANADSIEQQILENDAA
jgi:uncharacterized protein (DUF433 family)